MKAPSTIVKKDLNQSKLKRNENSKVFRSYSIIFLNWSVYYFAYFGLQFSVTGFGKLALLNFIFFGFIEIGGIYIATALSKRYATHVRNMRWLLFVAGISCLVIRDQSSALSLISILSQINSRQILDYFVLSDIDRVHS